MTDDIMALQDLLRLIEIEGVDINPCGGTHLTCTSQLQVLKLVGLEKSRGQARLRFMVGGRVIAALGSALTREAALNKVGCFTIWYTSSAWHNICSTDHGYYVSDKHIHDGGC